MDIPVSQATDVRDLDQQHEWFSAEASGSSLMLSASPLVLFLTHFPFKVQVSLKSCWWLTFRRKGRLFSISYKLFTTRREQIYSHARGMLANVIATLGVLKYCSLGNTYT